MSSSSSGFKPFRFLNRRSGGRADVSNMSAETEIQDASLYPHGLKVIAEGEDPTVDIVAVHGLDGHRDLTWTAENEINWLRDLLPGDIPQARIMSWGYDAHTRTGNHLSCYYLYDHARTLVSELCQERKHSNSAERPLIFVAHSLGGIVIKSALIHSDATRIGALQEHRSIKVSTYGVIFLGTPHQGANGVPLGRLLINIASLFARSANDRILKHLEQDSEWLQQQMGQYSLISDQFVTKFAYEEYPTPTAFGQSLLVVPRSSAVVPGHANAEPIAIHSNHHNMIKYKSREDSGYKTVSRHLKDMAQGAVEQTLHRWEIEKRSNAASASESTFVIEFSLSQVSEVTHFVAREEELTRLHGILSDGTGRRTVVIHGLGGMGKTQLAIAYAKHHGADYSAIFWANARDEASLKKAYLGMAEQIVSAYPSLTLMRRAVEANRVDEAIRTVNQWLDNAKNTRWLVIYDNYDSPLITNEGNPPCDTAPEGYDLKTFLPMVYHGAVIVTTRSSRVLYGHQLALKKLETVDHGLAIISHTSDRHDLHTDAAATELARELDGLPLALATAGAFLHNMPITCAEYLDSYKSSWKRLHTTTPSLPAYDQALWSTWNMSYTQISRQNPASAQVLQLWAYFDREDLWLELLQAGQDHGPSWFRMITADRIEFSNALRVLCDFGLAEPSELYVKSTESRGFSMHSCVHAWTVNVLNESKTVELAQLATACVILKIPSYESPEQDTIRRRLVPHALSGPAMPWNQIFNPTCDEDWLDKLGRFFGRQCLFKEAEFAFNSALRTKERDFIPSETSILDTLYQLGYLYDIENRWNEAEFIMRRVLKGREKALGQRDPSTLKVLILMGAIHVSQGQLKQAEMDFSRALRDCETLFGSEHSLTLTSLNCLARVNVWRLQLKEAEVLINRVLQVRLKTLGPDDTTTSGTMYNLAFIYVRQDRLQEAERMIRLALNAVEKATSLNHPMALKYAITLGHIQWKQGRLEEAETTLDHAIQGIEALFGSLKEDALEAMRVMGNVYRDGGRAPAAQIMYDRALNGHEALLKQNGSTSYLYLLDTLQDYAHFCSEQGDVEKAKKLYERCLVGMEDVLDDGHPRFKAVKEELNRLGY